MALLMTDMAQGSTAMRAMQQNVYGAEFDKQNAAADAEKRQLDNQKEQQNIQKAEAETQMTRLANVLSESKIQLDKDKKEALSKLMKDPEFSKASGEDQIKKMSIAIAAMDPAGSSYLMQAAAQGELKSAQAELKKQDAAARILGDASSVLKTMDLADGGAKFRAALDNMPKEQKEAIERKSPGFFALNDPKQQLKQLEGLMESASGHNLALTIAGRERVAAAEAASRERVASILAASRIAAKSLGTTKAETDKEARAWAQVGLQSSRIDQQFNKPIQEAEAARKKASVAVMAGGLSSWWNKDELKADYEKAWKAEMSLKKEAAQKKLDLLESAPPTQAAIRAYEIQLKQMESFDQEVPDPEKSSKTGPRNPPVNPKMPTASKIDVSNIKPDAAAKPTEQKKGATEVPEGIPKGSVQVGYAPDGKRVFKAPDGKQYKE